MRIKGVFLLSFIISDKQTNLEAEKEIMLLVGNISVKAV
jgi:hypothetical protein